MIFHLTVITGLCGSLSKKTRIMDRYSAVYVVRYTVVGRAEGRTKQC